MSHRVITAHVPSALARDVDTLAKLLDRPRGWVMKEALALYVDLERKRHDLTLEALAEVDAGRTLDHREVEVWAAALSRPKRARRR